MATFIFRRLGCKGWKRPVTFIQKQVKYFSQQIKLLFRFYNYFVISIWKLPPLQLQNWQYICIKTVVFWFDSRSSEEEVRDWLHLSINKLWRGTTMFYVSFSLGVFNVGRFGGAFLSVPRKLIISYLLLNANITSWLLVEIGLLE